MDVVTVPTTLTASTEVILSYNNFNKWLEYAQEKFQIEKVWKIVNGTKTGPDTIAGDAYNTRRLKRDFEDSQEKARGLLGRMIDADNKLLIRDIEDPAEAFKKIKLKHASTSLGERYNFLYAVLNITMSEDENLKSFELKVKRIYDQWASSLPADVTVDEIKKDLLVMSVVRPLAERFPALQAQILSKDDISMDSISSLLTATQSQEHFNIKKEIKVEAHLAKSNSTNNRSRQPPSRSPAPPSNRTDSNAPDSSFSCPFHRSNSHKAENCNTIKRMQSLKLSSSIPSSQLPSAVANLADIEE